MSHQEFINSFNPFPSSSVSSESPRPTWSSTLLSLHSFLRASYLDHDHGPLTHLPVSDVTYSADLYQENLPKISKCTSYPTLALHWLTRRCLELSLVFASKYSRDKGRW
jgi:hypothetical protein